MHVIPLGTNGFFPSFGRATACYAVLFKSTLIILDAGTGLFRLAEPEGGKLLRGVNKVHIFLSHYHLDHTFGFYGAWRIFKDKKVTVFGLSAKKVFRDIAVDYNPGKWQEAYKDYLWKKLDEGKHGIGDYKVLVRRQKHNQTVSLGYRFEFLVGKKLSTLSYITDSEASYETVEFVKNTDILLHEHYLSGEEKLADKDARLEDHFAGKHVTTVGAATIAKEAKVGKLALIHHFPFYNEKKLQQQLKIAGSIFPNTVLAQDLKEIVF